MLPQVDKTMNELVCFQAPIVDVLSELGFIVSGLAGLYGVYKTVTGDLVNGPAFVLTGVVGTFSSSYSKEISQTVAKSCSTDRRR